jgi:enterochelin esterase family protein
VASGRSRRRRFRRAYRYNINVDGVAVIDPRNPLTSVSNNNVWSLALVPGSDIFDTKDVPHGAVASITYYSAPLNRHRRMHVYTPPGYESGNTKYRCSTCCTERAIPTKRGRRSAAPESSWTISSPPRKAQPMIVVMPAGHTNGPTPGMGGPAPALTIATGQPDEFTQDFTMAIRPYIEQHYRVRTAARIARSPGCRWAAARR